VDKNCIDLCVEGFLKSRVKFVWSIDPKPERRNADIVGGALGSSELGLIQMLVKKQANVGDLGQQFPDDLNPLAGDFRGVEEHPSHIVTRPVQALHRAGRDRIGFEVERDNRNGF
jgi:hypothetical protein